MKFNVTKCDFCGKEERTIDAHANPLANSPMADAIKDDAVWHVVSRLNKVKEDWSCPLDQHICPDCYRHLKDWSKRPMTISANPSPVGERK